MQIYVLSRGKGVTCGSTHFDNPNKLRWSVSLFALMTGFYFKTFLRWNQMGTVLDGSKTPKDQTLVDERPVWMTTTACDPLNHSNTTALTQAWMFLCVEYVKDTVLICVKLSGKNALPLNVSFILSLLRYAPLPLVSSSMQPVCDAEDNIGTITHYGVPSNLVKEILAHQHFFRQRLRMLMNLKNTYDEYGGLLPC